MKPFMQKSIALLATTVASAGIHASEAGSDKNSLDAIDIISNQNMNLIKRQTEDQLLESFISTNQEAINKAVKALGLSLNETPNLKLACSWSCNSNP